MKHLDTKLIPLLETGSCTPQIAVLAKKIHEPAATIHYNIRKLEETGAIRGYKAVFNRKKIAMGLCTYILIQLTRNEYGDPEHLGKEIAKLPEVESVDVCTGEWELLVKVHTADIDAYYAFIKRVLTKNGVAKTTSMNALKTLKSEFMIY